MWRWPRLLLALVILPWCCWHGWSGPLFIGLPDVVYYQQELATFNQPGIAPVLIERWTDPRHGQQSSIATRSTDTRTLFRAGLLYYLSPVPSSTGTPLLSDELRPLAPPSRPCVWRIQGWRLLASSGQRPREQGEPRRALRTAPDPARPPGGDRADGCLAGYSYAAAGAYQWSYIHSR